MIILRRKVYSLTPEERLYVNPVLPKLKQVAKRFYIKTKKHLRDEVKGYADALENAKKGNWGKLLPEV